ncbi:transposase [Maribacter chungangensis]|uniref:Transposase n=1 Tax=Maribacter chungangensis TaxID=1069117 RepID=A0ABW3B2H2_9FLAO
MTQNRQSWDTAVKHVVRNGLINDILSKEQIASIPRSNIYRWKQEPNNKYQFCEINKVVQDEIHLIKRINQSSKLKKINQAYFELADIFHEIISSIKGIKGLMKERAILIVNSIEKVNNHIPINKAIKIFNLSRSTYENYKSIVVHTCEPSYFKWCMRRFSNQLLASEVKTIKEYMAHPDYKFWSKSSIYLKALRDKKLTCGISTFYKYCRLLGFKNRPRRRKSDSYRPVKTSKPNELWCADVTIFKTSDTTKHYIHFLMDHFSKFIIGYKVCSKPSAKTIKELLDTSYCKYRPDSLRFLTDGGSENVNTTLSNFIDSPIIPIIHIIAQKDVVYSNSMVEALNKVIKHQFLFPKDIINANQLETILKQSVVSYNTLRPQKSLGGNTPLETFKGKSVDITKYCQNFHAQKSLRQEMNRKNTCKLCI